MINNDLSYFDKKNYERFFEVEGATFLFATIFSHIYSDLSILILNKENILSIYLRNEYTKITRENGLSFLENNETEFIKFNHDFNLFIDNYDEKFKEIYGLDILNFDKKSITVFFDSIFKFFSFYRKTEFFYTELAYIKISNSSSSENLKINITYIEKLKTKGRELLIKIFNGSNSYLNKILEKIANFENISIELLNLLSYKEIINKIYEKTSIQLNSERLMNYSLTNLNNNECFFSNDKFNDIFKSYEIETTCLLNGTTANKGFIVGLARVIDANFNNFDHLLSLIEEMNENEILIAETTSPDLLIACKKASAIITNQGGLGSHAAIISRELNIPCIVGTKHATKFIKSGDLIEVDANNGIIKILEKNTK